MSYESWQEETFGNVLGESDTINIYHLEENYDNDIEAKEIDQEKFITDIEFIELEKLENN